MKNLFKKIDTNSIYLGIKKGYNMPTLPQNIIDFQNKLIIRIIRVLGGLSIILLISKKLNTIFSGNLLTIIYFICCMFMLMFVIYNLYIMYHKIVHSIRTLRSNKLDIRNSPLNFYALMWARAIYCSKGLCDVGANVGTVLGTAIGIDAIREYKGLDPIFKPILAKFIPTEYSEQAKALINERKRLFKNSNDLNVLEEEQKFYDTLCDNKFINTNDYLEVKQKIAENKDLITNENSQIMQSKILKALDELKNSKK